MGGSADWQVVIPFMLAPLQIPRAWMWSAWQPDRGMAFNSYLFERDGGCIAVDPLPLDAATLDEIVGLGGIKTIVLTNRDHLRDALQLRERFGARVVASKEEAALFDAPVDAKIEHGDEIFAGAIAVALPHGKTPGEIAIHFPDASAALVGDALIGAPAGSLSLLPDAKLQDRTQFALTLRRLAGLRLRTLLLCDGQPLFAKADAAIAVLLERCGPADIHRVNLDEIQYEVDEPGKYTCESGEVGLPIGARKIGYCIARIPPGKAYCPLHWHVQAEEFFYVIEGRPSIRTLRGTFACCPGDFIAFPIGESGAHQVINESDEPALVLLVGMEEDAVKFEACFYPDSDKVGLFTTEGRLRIIRASPNLDYYDGEPDAVR